MIQQDTIIHTIDSLIDHYLLSPLWRRGIIQTDLIQITVLIQLFKSRSYITSNSSKGSLSLLQLPDPRIEIPLRETVAPMLQSLSDCRADAHIGIFLAG